MNIINRYLFLFWSYRIIFVSIIAVIFIYFRTLDYYKSIPRHNIIASILVVIWSYATLTEPLFLLVGLVLLNIFGEKHLIDEIK